MFKVMRSGKRQKKQWKRMVTKPTFVGAGFTRKPPKYERFIRPTGMPSCLLPTTAGPTITTGILAWHCLRTRFL